MSSAATVTDCETGQCAPAPDHESLPQPSDPPTAPVPDHEDATQPLTFTPPLHANVPSITIEFCDRVSRTSQLYISVDLTQSLASVDGKCNSGDRGTSSPLTVTLHLPRLHRATWIQTELFLTFQSPTLESITLTPLRAPETSGRFRVWLFWRQPLAVAEGAQLQDVIVNELLWDRKSEGGFPELKVLVCRCRTRCR